MFAVRCQRPAPYLWSDADIRRLLEAARALRPPLRAATYEALFGLLAVIRHAHRRGDRRSSATTSTSTTGVITIREQVAKLERARLVPLHPTTTDALDRYASRRETACAPGRARERSSSPAPAPRSIAAG